MYGAIIGDIVGSRFEMRNQTIYPHKSKNFTLFTEECAPTDDSVMTVAIAESAMTDMLNVIRNFYEKVK